MATRKSTAPSASAPPAFAFCAARVDAGTTNASAWSYPLVFGLLATLSPQESETLGVAVTESNRRWERRANPFVDDLEDLDPDEPLATWLEHAPAAAKTAVAAAKTTACGADRWCVQVIGRGGSCPAGFFPVAEGTRDAARARFLAWPFGYAIWLRARSAEEASKSVAALRALPAKESRIGLVLHASDDERTRESSGDLREGLLRHEVLREAATTQGNAEDSGTEAPFQVAKDGGSGGAGAFPVELSALDVIVMPRLGALHDPRGFEAEVAAATPNLVVSR
jgi:hypothetical protein